MEFTKVTYNLQSQFLFCWGVNGPYSFYSFLVNDADMDRYRCALKSSIETNLQDPIVNHLFHKGDRLGFIGFGSFFAVFDDSVGT